MYAWQSFESVDGDVEVGFLRGQAAAEEYIAECVDGGSLPIREIEHAVSIESSGHTDFLCDEREPLEDTVSKVIDWMPFAAFLEGYKLEDASEQLIRGFLCGWVFGLSELGTIA